MLTATMSLSLTPNFSASSGVAWICLFATITPSTNSISPAGPTNLQAALPATSPDSLIGAATPNVRASDKETSTCVAFLAGPKILTFLIVFFGPTKSTLSTQAYWPGWDKSFLGV